MVIGLRFHAKASAKRCLPDSWSRILFHSRIGTPEAITIDAILTAATTPAKEMLMDQGVDTITPGTNDTNNGVVMVQMMSS